jgi:hypothetical protein
MLLGAAVVVAVLVALLAIPVTLRFDVRWDRALRHEVRLVWAFGLVRVRLGPRGAKGQASASEAAAAAGEEPRAEAAAPEEKPQRVKLARSKRKLNVLAALRLQRFRRRIFRLVRDVWRAVHPRDLSLRLRLGLDDPAATGQLWALLGPVAGWLATFRAASITIEPEFAETALELETRGSLRVVPLRALGIALALALSPAVWQGVRVMRARG